LRRRINPQEAFQVLRPILNRGTEVFIAVNPAYAYRWSINNNAYTIASAMKKLEEAQMLEKNKEMIDWLKIVVPIGILAFMLAMAFYIVVMATHTGANPLQAVSHVVPHATPAPTPKAVHNPGKLKI